MIEPGRRYRYFRQAANGLGKRGCRYVIYRVRLLNLMT